MDTNGHGGYAPLPARRGERLAGLGRHVSTQDLTLNSASRTTDDVRKIKIDIMRSKIHGNVPNNLCAIYCQNNMLPSG